jgi:hypothetical protein
MSDEINEREWHEFPWEDAIDLPPGPHKKLKLLADANIPKLLIDGTCLAFKGGHS